MGRPVAVIGAPTSAGAYAPGQEKAPRALREAGLAERLRERGVAVVDRGDIRAFRWCPDAARPRAQNAEAVAESARLVAAAVRTARAAGQFALVLGGDCTIEIGTVAGHLPTADRLGLIYFDLHPDLNVPSSTIDGALDWMGLAHLLGEEDTVQELRDIGPRQPLLEDSDVILFGTARARMTTWEREVVDRRRLAVVPFEVVRDAPERAARQALETADRRGWRQILVHLDVDCIDFNDAPLSEHPGRGTGLTLEVAFRALAGLFGGAGPRFGALTIAELNPDHGDEEGMTLTRFVDGLVTSLALIGDLGRTGRSRSDRAGGDSSLPVRRTARRS